MVNLNGGSRWLKLSGAGLYRKFRTLHSLYCDFIRYQNENLILHIFIKNAMGYESYHTTPFDTRR